MGSCTWFGAVSGNGLLREKDWREGESECVVVLSGGELDGGRRVTMWVSPQNFHVQAVIIPFHCHRIYFFQT